MSTEGGQEGRVAVKIRYAVRKDEQRNEFVAHFIALGLIARGQTEEEATRRCKQLFNKFVRAYRSVGQLAMRLEQAGAQWWWIGEYPKESPEPENTDLLNVPPAIPDYGPLYEAIKEVRRQEAKLSDLAVAA